MEDYGAMQKSWYSYFFSAHHKVQVWSMAKGDRALAFCPIDKDTLTESQNGLGPNHPTWP